LFNGITTSCNYFVYLANLTKHLAAANIGFAREFVFGAENTGFEGSTCWWTESDIAQSINNQMVFY